MFSHYLRKLDSIPRWVLIHSIKSQSVASHTAMVAIYVTELMESYHSNWSAQKKYETLKAALAHDAAEARMSDIPGPIKRDIRDPQKYEEFEQYVLYSMDMLHGWEIDEDAALLIKVADLIDEYMFMRTEQWLGNQTVDKVIRGADNCVEERLKQAIINAGLGYDLFFVIAGAADAIGIQFEIPGASTRTLLSNLDTDIPF